MNIEEMVEATVPLARHIVSRMTSRGRAATDMREAAMSGALHALHFAAKRFDPTRGVKFGTYAGACVRGYVLTELENVPRHKDHELSEVNEPSRWDRDMAQAEVNEEVHLALSHLPPRHRFVVERTYLEGLRCVDVGKELGLSRARVQQIREQGLAMLRNWLRITYEPAPEVPKPPTSAQSLRQKRSEVAKMRSNEVQKPSETGVEAARDVA